MREITASAHEKVLFWGGQFAPEWYGQFAPE